MKHFCSRWFWFAFFATLALAFGLLWAEAAAAAPSQGCGGCEPWVQSDGDLDPTTTGFASVSLDVGRGCLAYIDAQVFARAPGACGPGLGTTCTEPLGPATFTLSLAHEAPPGVRLFWNDGTYGLGLTWTELPAVPCGAPGLDVARLSRSCGSTSWLWFLAWDELTGATSFGFLTLGAAPCPKPD